MNIALPDLCSLEYWADELCRDINYIMLDVLHRIFFLKIT